MMAVPPWSPVRRLPAAGLHDRAGCSGEEFSLAGVRGVRSFDQRDGAPSSTPSGGLYEAGRSIPLAWVIPVRLATVEVLNEKSTSAGGSIRLAA